jgi:LPXTG-motif cell wall-anchored protein
MGMAFIFSVPMAEIVQLPAGSYAGMFSNRNDGSGTAAANEDFHVTILKDATSIEPGPGVRPPTLATIAGFFGGDSAARTFSFKLFGETGLPLGQIMNDRQPVLTYLQDQLDIDLSVDLNTLLDDILRTGDRPDYEQNEETLQLLDGVAQNGGHAIAWLVELFNPQTYPTRDFMNYALLDKAQSRNRVLNEVQYSKIWTRKEAETYIARLPEFLDNFSAFCYEQTFLDWLYDRLKEAWDLDMRELYTTENMRRLLDFIEEQAGELLPWLGLPELILDEGVIITDRDSFIEALTRVLLPAAPMLKTLLIGGRASDVPWFGEQYANNGQDFDPQNTAPGLGRAGDNLTILNEFIGFSGYDGYKHGVIPILEAFGVPQRDILPYEEFVRRATGENGDAEFFAMLIEPLCAVVDSVVADPIGELPQTLANIIYFIAAEGGNENMAKDGSAKNGFVEAVNRIFRPIYAALDMVTPMAEFGDLFSLLGLDNPFQLSVGGMHQDVLLTPDISLNSIVTGLARRWFAELSDELGLELSLALEDIMETLTGTLTVYRSVNGQNDALRLEIDRADMFTQAARRLLPLIFSEDNWQEMRLCIAARLPANTRNAALYLLDALANMVRGMEPGKAADLVLAVLFHLFLGKNHMIEKLFALRECRDRLIAFFEKLSINDALGPIAVLAGATLAAGAAVPIGIAGLGAAVLGGLGLTGLAAWLLSRNATRETAALPKPGETVDSSQEKADMPGYVMPPKTGDSPIIAIAAAFIGSLALGAALTLRKRRKHECEE